MSCACALSPTATHTHIDDGSFWNLFSLGNSHEAQKIKSLHQNYSLGLKHIYSIKVNLRLRAMVIFPTADGCLPSSYIGLLNEHKINSKNVKEDMLTHFSQ